MGLAIGAVLSGSATNPCCCGVCCLYPWPDPAGTPLYPDTDLPDTIILIEPGSPGTQHTLTRSGYEFSGDGFIIAPAITGDPSWQGYIGSVAEGNEFDFNSPCLIIGDVGGASHYGVIDEFLDAYTADGDTITRTSASSCEWFGSKSGGGTWTHDYGITTPYKFHLSSDGGSPTSDDKTDPQNKPDGTYGAQTVS